MSDEFNPMDQFKMHEALQQQQSDENLKLYAPQIQEQRAQSQAVVISETDPMKDIRSLIMQFEGKEEIDGTITQVTDPVMNKYGINRISQILRPLMINTIRFTRLKNQSVKLITYRFVDDLTLDLGLNWREYGIPDRSTIDHIINSVGTLVFAILSRAEDQNEKNWIGRISFENVSPTKLTSKKGESWLDKFKL